MNLSMSSDLWTGVDRLIDRADSFDGLAAHGLYLLAIRRWHATGVEVPVTFGVEELSALQKAHDARQILVRAREAYDGRIAVLKGLEVAARYPAEGLRPSVDLDILVDDADEAQRAMIAAGFQAIGDFDDSYYDGLHHVRPLHLPDHPSLAIEVHRWPSWVEWSDPPSTDELLSLAGPSRTGIDGILALPDAHHALLVAAHSWAERPLRRVLDLVDVAALADDAARSEAARLAGPWGLAGVWNATMAASDAVLFDGPVPWSLRTWARDLRQVRDRTVLEDHVRRLMSTFWALPPHRALVATGVALAREVTPAPDETWANKLSRAREALLHPSRPSAKQAEVIGREGIQPRHKRR
jgi:hypothetical protein